MQSDDTSVDDVPIGPDAKIDLISSLRKENSYLQTKIEELQTELHKFQLLDVKYRNSIDKLKKANSEIADLKCRLQISINQNQENQKQLNIERYAQNHICYNELNKLKNNKEQILQQNNIISNENQKLKEEIDSLAYKHDIDIAFTQNQNRILLASASSFFKIELTTMEQLKDYFLNNSLPPSILPEKDKKIESQLKMINDLKKKCRSIKKEYESLILQKQTQIDHLNEKIQSQDLIINDLNLQIEQKNDFYNKKISKIQSKIPKKKKLYKFTSPTITIIPNPAQILEIRQEKSNRAQNFRSTKLIEELNEAILKLQEDNRKIQNESLNYQIQLQKFKSENESKEAQIAEYEIKIKSLKKEFELKIKSANDKINELRLSNKIPDPFTEHLISSAKSKIHQQKESIIFKDSQLSKLTGEVNHLKLIVSQQKVDIARLKAELSNRSDHLCDQLLNQQENSFCDNLEQPNNQTKSEPYIFNYSNINSKLRTILRPIIENNSLSIESKMQLGIRKVDTFYSEKLEKMKKFKEINFSIENFLSELIQLINGRHIDIESLSKNAEFQAQLIDELKENKIKMESLQRSSFSQNGEITNLNRKLTKMKEKLASNAIQQKKIESMKSELENLICENNKLKTENADFQRMIALLKSENAELYSVLEYERGHIICIKKEQGSSLGEYEALLRKMKKKCSEQRKTIKCLAGCNC